MTDSTRGRFGRPLMAVTGVGLVTPLGFGVSESWAGLLAGRSGIRRVTRFPTEHLKTTIAGTVDLPEDAAGGPLPASARVERFAALAAEGVNIKALTTSEIKVSVLIDRKYLELAVQALHDAFELEKAG